MSHIDLNPHISILDDAATKKQLAELTQRALELGRHQHDHRLSEEQMEQERFQAESNALAEENPLYAAARSAAVNFLVVPLDGTSPIVDPKAATNDAHLLFKWWQEWPEANPGILLGRIGGALALHIEDDAAHLRLRELAKVVYPEVEDGRHSVKSFIEYRDLGGYYVRLLPDSQSFSLRIRTGWGRPFTRAVIEQDRQARQQYPETFWLVFSYPSVTSGMDAFEYRTRNIDAGVKLLGEGEVLAWNGATLDDGIRVSAPLGRPPEVPLWLANTIGKPRSRKVMAAAREAHEAAMRGQGTYPFAEAEAARTAEARKALAEAEA
jgi:Bifunctional DNA primase/polymerase, N-terminal